MLVGFGMLFLAMFITFQFTDNPQILNIVGWNVGFGTAMVIFFWLFNRD
jgi:hypothetical protein